MFMSAESRLYEYLLLKKALVSNGRRFEQKSEVLKSTRTYSGCSGLVVECETGN